MAVSNNITAILNFLAVMCSIPVIAAGIWLASKPDNDCIHWLRWPIIFLGVSILAVSLAGFFGAYWKKKGLLAVYLVFMMILIVLLLATLVLAFVVTRHGGGYSVTGAAFQEYRLQGFSSWLRDHITSSDNWVNIRSCLATSPICPNLAAKFTSPAGFFAAHLSPIQSGCCKPPMACGLQYSTPTTWIGEPNIAADPDCAIWSNDQSKVCYDCKSCKAGLLGNLRQEWRRANTVLIITVVVLIWVYLIAFCAYRNAQTEDIFIRYKQGWV